MTVWRVAHFIGGCVSLVKLTQESQTGNITEGYKYYFQAGGVSKVVQQCYLAPFLACYTHIIIQLKFNASTNDTGACIFFILTYLAEMLYQIQIHGVSPMPTPEIHYSHSFGMGFWIAEDGTLMSCPAMDDADGRTTMDVDNAIAVDEWDDPSVYSPEHMIVLAQIVQICTLKRDYVNIGYYAERFSPVA